MNSATHPAPALIGIDWGTSSLRAFLLAAEGRVLQQSESDEGVLTAAALGFAHVLQRHIGQWQHAWPGLPVLMCGMVGSRQGWHEAAYLPCPASLSALGVALCRVTTPDAPSIGHGGLHIVPGLSMGATAGSGTLPDVMRGEETQIAGVFDAADASGLCVLPGTHSKWARVVQGRIEGFATHMTGELFALLRQHSILGRLMPEDATHDAGAFVRGVQLALADEPASQGLLHQLFSVRSLGLFGHLAPAALESYLSGLLIGNELLQARRAGFLAPRGEAAAPVVIVGNHRLGQLYRQALDSLGLPSTTAPTDAAARGLWRIARAAALIETTA